MYRVVSQSGHTSYGLKQYVCDLDSDINNLPITDIAGSEAYVIESGETYILSNAHEWKVKRSSSSSIDTSKFEEQIADLSETVDFMNHFECTVLSDTTIPVIILLNFHKKEKKFMPMF